MIIKEQTKKLLEHLEKNGKDRSWPALTIMFSPGSNAYWSRDIARRHGVKFNEEGVSVEAKVTEVRQVKELRQVQNESSKLTQRVIELENDLTILANIKEYEPRRFKIPPPSTKNKREATAIIQWSDWHVDEKVDSQAVNHMNEYDPKIAESRAKKLFENTVKLVNSQRSAVNIPRLILHLGGDNIGGYLHPELEQTNSMSPIEGIFFAKELIISGIDYILAHGQFNDILIVCSRGNHGRLTKKMQYSNDYSMNLETFLYYSLMDHYRKNKKVAFKIDKSDLSYITVYDKVLRFFHGWQIKSQGGIGGIGIPLYKKIHRWNNNIHAYYNFMCDKHCYSNPTPDCQLNGSLKGYDSFAESNGFSYQPPMQSFTLLDSKRGITIKAPIYCD